MGKKRTIFYVSDRTGITAETLGHTLLTQFEELDFQETTLPFINSPDKAKATVDYVNYAAKKDGSRPIIFSTTVSDEIREILRSSEGLFLDLFDTYIPQIEQELEIQSSHAIGRAHGLADQDRYEDRISAMNYALDHDDGQTTRNLDRADVILIAPSRCGKTPTCIYLAMHHGLYAANYPLTEEDLEKRRLPEFLDPLRERLFGLTSDPQRLHQMRSERRPGSKYASLQQCAFELRQAEQLFSRFSIPSVKASDMSIEEIATLVMEEKKLRRRSF